MSISYICTELTEGFVSIASECECEEECIDCEGGCEGACMVSCEFSCQCSIEGCETCQSGQSVPSSPNISVSLSGRTATWTWNKPSGTEYFSVTHNGVSLPNWGLGTSLEEILSPGETGTVCVRACNSIGCSSSDCASATAPITGEPPSKVTNLRVTSVAEDAAMVAFSPSENADEYNVYLDGVEFYVILASQWEEGNALYVGGLAPGTTYQICVDACNAYGCSGDVCVSATTEGMVRPSDWEWSYPIVSGDDVYLTVNENGIIKAYIMPYYEWNNFTKRIDEFRLYLKLSNYYFTTVWNDDDFTKEIINEAVFAINEMGFNIPQIVNNEVPASVFNNMRDALNSIE